MGELGHSMDLPFEPTSGEMHDTAEAIYSGGVVVLAAVIDVPDVGPSPALVWRFAMPDGSFHPPIVLVADDDQMAKLRPLVSESIAAARRGAQIQRRGDRGPR